MTELISAPNISTVGGLDATSVFPVTTSAGTNLYQATGAEIAAAYGGSGSGASITMSIMQARAAGYTTGYTSGSKIDALVTQGDLRGLLLDAYCSGSNGSDNPISSVTATVTVPTGKKAILLAYNRSSQVFTDSTYYKHWIYNSTTATQYAPSIAANSYHGFVVPEGANSTITYPYIVGVAGDTLILRAASAGDRNSRTVAGYAIIALADATTGAFDPGGGW